MDYDLRLRGAISGVSSWKDLFRLRWCFPLDVFGALSLEFLDECAIAFPSLVIGDFIGIGLLMNRDGVVKGWVVVMAWLSVG